MATSIGCGGGWFWLFKDISEMNAFIQIIL
jgi:hypothetical protein